MEQQFGLLNFYYGCFCLFLALVFLHAKFGTGKRHRPRLPPGPWQLPVIGSLHHLLRRGLPHHTMRDLSLRHGPLMLLRICERVVFVVNSAEAAREVFMGHGTAFEQRPSSPGIDEMSRASRHGVGVIFAPYGERWRRLRRILVTELLSSRRVGEFRRIREEEAARLAASLASSTSIPGQLVNMDERLAEFVADSSVRAIFGDRLPDRDSFLRMVKRGVELSSLFDLRDLFPTSRIVRTLPRSRKAEQHLQEMFRLIDGVLRHHEERKTAAGEREKEQDMIDVLLRIQEDGAMRAALTPGVIRAVLTDVFGAAIDTATTTLQWAMGELIANPRVMEKAQLEVRHALAGQQRVREAALSSMPYLKAVVKETLRLHPPAPFIPRSCLEDQKSSPPAASVRSPTWQQSKLGPQSARVRTVRSLITHKIQGYDVPKGTILVVNAWAISRDPTYWQDSEKFMPERFEGDHALDFKGLDFEFTPFGAGRRICPGITFAQANVEIALATLLHHFDWELPRGAKPEELDMTEQFGVTVTRKSQLLLSPVPRIPALD
ncbi:hypothetical protein EJB05_27454, partial [Eragrostis curvula]